MGNGIDQEEGVEEAVKMATSSPLLPSLYHLMFFPLLLVVSVESTYKVDKDEVGTIFPAFSKLITCT